MILVHDILSKLNIDLCLSGNIIREMEASIMCVLP